MAIVEVIRGGWTYKCVTPSDPATWRLKHDGQIVNDLIETKGETLQIHTLEIFEGETREDCIAEIDRLGLYFDPEVERSE